MQLVLVFVALYLRLYVHFIGQWLFLRGMNIPVYDFRPTPYSIVLKYVASAVHIEIEMGMVVVGQLFVIGVFLVMCAASFVSQVATGHFPHISSHFVAYFGFGAVLDAGLILVVDVVAGNFDCGRLAACATDISNDACKCSEGDAFKLYNRFSSNEGSGVVGIVLTVLLFVVLLLVALFVLYTYLVKLHLDGRLLDLYRRLCAPESAFLIPHDMEISPNDLAEICMKAQRWTGSTGSKRKIAVCDYSLTDPLDARFEQVTTHVAIYHVSAVGSDKELYRHFLRLHDGTLLELFGEMDRHFGVSAAAPLSKRLAASNG